jgi:hypothetical protein
MTPLPTDLDAIASIPDGALRNLLITQRYHDLSAALAETLEGDAFGNVNWSTFATWASKTAGLSIRDEEVPPFVDKLAAEQSLLVAPVRATLRNVSQSIADGNLKVFAELAPIFAKFVKTFRDTPGADDARLAAFVGAFDPAPSSDGGQQPLIGAFTAYYKAMKTTDEAARARCMLLGNCLIGLHEQTRLQPQIKDAMDAPIDLIVPQHLPPAPGGGFFASLIDRAERSLEEVTQLARDAWEVAATQTMMSLSLPDGATLSLGRNIPPTAAARSYLPAALEGIADPTDLVALLQQFDRAHGDSDTGSRSIDWRVLEDRMNFIVNLFRSRQQDAELMGPPFNADQRAAFEARKMPGPDLGRL